MCRCCSHCAYLQRRIALSNDKTTDVGNKHIRLLGRCAGFNLLERVVVEVQVCLGLQQYTQNSGE